MVRRFTLADDYPDLIRFFDSKCEPGLDPASLYVTAPGQFPWVCDRGHSTRQTVRSRIKGCRLCAGKKFLDEHFPELVEEFDGEMNPGVNPSNLYPRSSGIYFWRCPSGFHSWPATVRARLRGSSCIYCAGIAVLPGFNDIISRIDASKFSWVAEENLDSSGDPIDPSAIPAWDTQIRVWWCVKGNHRKEISPAALMNASSKGRNCRECEGLAPIQGRTDAATALGVTAQLLDNTFHDIAELSQVSGGSEAVFSWRCDLNPDHRWKRSVRGMKASARCPDCEGRRLVPGENDLATARPDLASEWDFEKNAADPEIGLAGPWEVTQSSGIRVHWVCYQGHKWMATPNGRTGQNLGCAFCSDRRCWPGFNDLKTKAPELLDEIDWEKESDLNPAKLLWVSHRKIAWICPNDPTHKWEAPVWYRTKGRNGTPQICPNCNTTGFSPSVPYLLYYLRNDNLLAAKVGITKVNSSRLAAFQKHGWSLVHSWRFETGRDAMTIEQIFHTWRRETMKLPNFLGSDDVPRRLGGQDETFSDEAIDSGILKRFINSAIATSGISASETSH